MNAVLISTNISCHFPFKGIVSRDWEGLLMGSVDRYLVLDVLATYLFLILMSTSYVKFYICLLGWYVILLLGGG
jgi:hypothetical protein